ncbi:MAG: hypothetical protein WCE64_04595 [Bacteroidales bacterium]
MKGKTKILIQGRLDKNCYQWQMAKTDFGFNVWFIPGNGGQIINIVPALNMVIVVNADNRNIPKEERLPLEILMQNIIKIHPEFYQL